MYASIDALIWCLSKKKAGPYYCAESSLTFALGRCMTNPENIPTADLIAITSDLGTEGRIDDPANMAGDNVYIFHGSVDDVVAFGNLSGCVIISV